MQRTVTTNPRHVHAVEIRLADKARDCLTEEIGRGRPIGAAFIAAVLRQRHHAPGEIAQILTGKVREPDLIDRNSITLEPDGPFAIPSTSSRTPSTELAR